MNTTRLEETTLSALDSPNPFQTPPKPTMKNGKPVAPSPAPASAVAEAAEEEPKRGPGRPRQTPIPDPARPRRKPGRPPKISLDAIEAALEDIQEPVFENPIAETRSQTGSPDYRVEWPGRDVFVGFHCNFDTNVATAFGLLALALDFGKDKIRFDYATDPDPNDAKNALVALFLQTDAPWLLMVGNDIVPSIGRAPFTRRKLALPVAVQDNVINRHVLHRLMGAGRKLVGASYFGKQAGAPVACSHPNAVALTRQHTDVVYPVDWVGSGMLLVHRRVFEDIEATDPSVRPGKPNAPLEFFKSDAAFCALAKKAGHQAHCDFGIPVYNVGRHAFGGGNL